MSLFLLSKPWGSNPLARGSGAIVARRLASLIYLVSAGAARCQPQKAHDHRERGSLSVQPAIGFKFDCTPRYGPVRCLEHSRRDFCQRNNYGYPGTDANTDARIFQVSPTRVYTFTRYPPLKLPALDCLPQVREYPPIAHKSPARA